jgi:tRNA-splicing endonuclease subunit Sen34
MPASNAPTAPDLPFPIFQVSSKVERYLLYDINTISWLRRTHNILGVLIGTLPQIPQQNVFLGLPLELQPEEARLLVEKGLAYTVNDLDWHTKDLASKTGTQIESIRADLHRDGLEVARELEKNKQKQTREALKKLRSNSSSTTSSDSTASPDPQPQDNALEETLFDNPSTKEPTQTRSTANPKPWTITPTTSYPPLSRPPDAPSPVLPKVNPSSYALFAHLHDKGYFITPGIRFGCQFSVYPGDPLRFHSHFLAMSAEWDEEISLLDLVGGGRLGTGVKKGWMIGGVEEKEGASRNAWNSKESDERKSGGAGIRTFCIEWGGM